MTPNHDHATLFQAPPAAPAVRAAAAEPQAALDDSDAAMRRLRDPFTVEAAPAATPSEAVPAV